MSEKGKQDFDGMIDGVGYKGSMDDPAKPPMGLVPPELAWLTAQVLGYGAQKYARGQWMRGMSFTEVSNALERHLTAWKRGEEMDSESNLPHLGHIACCVAFLAHFQYGPRCLEYRRFDDRLFKSSQFLTITGDLPFREAVKAAYTPRGGCLVGEDEG